MMSTTIIYVVLFFNSLLLIASVLCLKKIISILKINSKKTHSYFNSVFDEVIKVQEKTVSSKEGILSEILDMRKEWDMEALKQNILQRGHGDSKKWDNWRKAFSGVEVKKGDN